MERPSRAAYAGPSFQKAIASVASATDGAAPNNPAKLLGRKTSASRAKVETANPPMKKRMTYSSVTPRPPRAHADNPHRPPKVRTQAVIVSQPCVGSAAQGHSAPLSIQARISSPSACWVLGTGSRLSPGCQPQATKSSFATCSCSNSRFRPPLRCGSFHLPATPHSRTSLAKLCRSAPGPSGDGRECSGTTPAGRPKCRRCDLNGRRCTCCRVRRLRRLRAWQAANADACHCLEWGCRLPDGSSCTAGS